MNGDYATESELADLKTGILERSEKVETTLLKEFHKWAVICEARLRTTESWLSD